MRRPFGCRGAVGVYYSTAHFHRNAALEMRCPAATHRPTRPRKRDGKVHRASSALWAMARD
eukprot:2539809-Pyramimonas_sp.AAC.1